MKVDARYYLDIANKLSARKDFATDFNVRNDIYQVLMGLRDEVGLDDSQIRQEALRLSQIVCDKTFDDMKNIETLNQKIGNLSQEELYDLYYKLLLYEAPHLFEPYLLYMEKNRAIDKQFYAPRKNTLGIVVRDLQDLEDRKIKFLGVSLPPRVGKAIEENTPVLTSKGWKPHGKLAIGDMVLGIDGRFKMVYIVYPKCDMEYRVTFSDGDSVICHGEHEWIIYDEFVKKEDRVSTKFMYESGLFVGKTNTRRFKAAHNRGMLGSKLEFQVHPYVFGCWLGGGENKNPVISIKERDRIILSHIQRFGEELGFTKQNGKRYSCGIVGLRERLQVMGMCYSTQRTEKTIPIQYLRASEEQRADLLAGIIDTIGFAVPEKARYVIRTKYSTLKDDIVDLIRTFGWRASVSTIKPKKTSIGFERKNEIYDIQFCPTYTLPCKLARKQFYDFRLKNRISVVNIEKVEGYKGNCVAVQDFTYCVGKTLKPTHNSTLCIFFMSWIMGKRPNEHNAMSGHSGILADGFYNEITNLITTQEYTFGEIFPDVSVQKKSAEKKEINLNDPDRFSTLTCRGIDGTWTGSVDISNQGYLYVDDLIRDRTESLSPTRLEGRYQDYLNVLVDRKNTLSRELMVGTRWNLYDPLGKIEQKFRDNPLFRFRKIPALNDNDESNFDYDFGKGFTTEYYKEMRDRLDPNEWMAKFQQRPFLREGIMFDETELRYYNGILPEGGFVRNVAVCDVAWGGGDSLSMPVGAEYENGDIYIFDWVFNTGAKEVTLPMVVGRIMANNIQSINFEANNGGEMYEFYVSERLKANGYPCSCSNTKAPNKLAKKEKINQYAGDIKNTFIFLDRQHRSKEYEKAMEELTTFVYIGENPHDDSPDSLTQLAMRVHPIRQASIEAVKNPLWR